MTIIGNPLRAVVVTDNENPTKITLREVKNLGWLLRHWDEVTDFVVTETPDRKLKHWDCVLRANLSGDPPRYYACTWADRGVLSGWLKRPVFIGRQINWFGKYTIISKENP